MSGNKRCSGIPLSVAPGSPLAQVHQAVDQLRHCLQSSIQGEVRAALPCFTWPSTFESLAQRFSLNPFEQFILLLCVAMELDFQIAQLYGQVMGHERLSSPTFALALALFPQADWQALAAHSPLLRWQLLELAPHPTLAQAPLKIQPRVLALSTAISRPRRLRRAGHPT
ncbi:MAG: hypothetical protein AAGG51_23690 [Cyanobacteria bacterium P01_G01_bin.54]